MAALSVAHTPAATEQALEDAHGGLATPVNQTMQTLLTSLVTRPAAGADAGGGDRYAGGQLAPRQDADTVPG
ncbi:MAG: hypothetical protein ACR5LG_13335 [Sodalis sp. (in: enterobacteria)]|uniref:hypothetical protein n=1 Tax=Sodalis sp. (in: enterobacteria) TaxID=1898979 RepID=UPI003F2DB592